MIKKYKDFIDSGESHKAYYINQDWILKMPKNKSKKDLENFENHIRYIQKYPDVFVKVKEFNGNSAVIENVDTSKAQKEIAYLGKVVNTLLPKKLPLYLQTLIQTDNTIVHFLYNLTDDKKIDDISNKLLKDLKEYGLKNNNVIINRWVNFIEKLIKTFDHHWLDLHWGNFGINKNGEVKLIDF